MLTLRVCFWVPRLWLVVSAVGKAHLLRMSVNLCLGMCIAWSIGHLQPSVAGNPLHLSLWVKREGAQWRADESCSGLSLWEVGFAFLSPWVRQARLQSQPCLPQAELPTSLYIRAWLLQPGLGFSHWAFPSILWSLTKYGLHFKRDELGTAVFSTPPPLCPALTTHFWHKMHEKTVGATPLARGQFQKQTLECVLPN